MNFFIIISIILHFTGAVIIACVWLFFLGRLNKVFRPKPVKPVIIAFLLGCLSTLILLGLQEVFGRGFGDVTDGSLRCFIQAFLYIGIPEEIIKIVPLVIILVAFDYISEPVDYMVLACASALGFATIENTLYFFNFGPELYFPRGLISSLVHICLTGITVYGIILGEYRYARPHVLVWFLITLVVASLLHAMHDFLLFSVDSVSKWLFVLSLILYLSMVETWTVMMNNSLNQSPWFNRHRYVDAFLLQKILLAGFGIILAFQWQVSVIMMGIVDAFISQVLVFLISGLLFAVVSFRVSRFKLLQDHWFSLFSILPVNLFPQRQKFLRMRGGRLAELRFHKMWGCFIGLRAVNRHKRALGDGILARIIDKIEPGNEEALFMAQLYQPVNIEGYLSGYAVLAPNYKDFDSDVKHKNMAALLMIPGTMQPECIKSCDGLGFYTLVYVRHLKIRQHIIPRNRARQKNLNGTDKSETFRVQDMG